MASLSLQGIQKIYPNGFHAVKDFNLEIADKEFIIFVGPSGCGKSTTLRMIAGLEDISGGTFKIDGKVMNDVEPKDRDIAMVFQNYALYPHMTVYDNMAFGLKLRKVPKDEIDKKVREAAKILDLEKLLDRKPKALSGGQRQRVAMGRAIVRNPKVFLMDEPLSNLDAKLRVQMRIEISKIHQRLGATIIYVTHDQTEAMTLGTRIVVMKDGVVQQVDTPQNLYQKPGNLFVAGFIPCFIFIGDNCLDRSIVFCGSLSCHKCIYRSGTACFNLTDKALTACDGISFKFYLYIVQCCFSCIVNTEHDVSFVSDRDCSRQDLRCAELKFCSLMDRDRYICRRRIRRISIILIIHCHVKLIWFL